MEGGEIGELQDWEEVGLHSACEEDEDGHVGHGSFSSIEAEAEGMIKHDYFSLDNQARFSYAKSEAGSVESDNPSWIDPVSVSVYKDSGGFWSDSASDDRSDDRRSNDFEAKNELGFAGIEEREALLEHVAEGEAGFGEIRRLESSIAVESEVKEELGDEEGVVEEVKAVARVSGGEEEGEKRMVLWWKVPLEVLKYCVFKVSPVWSFSVAAAVMGLVILGRRLYRMKRRNRSLQLKVAMDDKKVSQFMSRAVRLNEAFSVVRRVPVLRPSLPAAVGVNPWPVMSLR